MTMTLALLLALFPQDEADRRIEMMVRNLREQLKLTEEQTNQIRDVLKQLEKERQEKIKSHLTDEQKKAYDEYLKNGGRDGGAFRQRGGMFGGFGADQLKEPLGLNDEQVEKLRGVIDAWTAEMRKKMEGGNFNWREEMPKLLEELGNKIKEHLTPEQKEKFDKFVQERMRGFGGFGGRDGERRRPPVEERANRTIEQLKIADDKERAVILDLLTKALKARDASEDYEREYRDKVRELTRAELSEEALEARLNELREERKKREKDLAASRKELAEVVTFRQELILIEQGILK